MNKPLIVIGGGGHASVLVDILHQQKRDIVGIVSPEINSTRKVFQGIPHYIRDEDVLSFSPDTIKLINGLGSLPGSKLRKVIYEKFVMLGYEFESVIATSAIVSTYVTLAKGSQILPNAIIQTGATIGENTIINTGAIVEHDCSVGNNNHLAPSATLSGGVITKENVHIGTGASIIQSITIEAGAIIGAGSVVTKNVGPETIVYPPLNAEKAL